jgi:hypothetical protein
LSSKALSQASASAFAAANNIKDSVEYAAQASVNDGDASIHDDFGSTLRTRRGLYHDYAAVATILAFFLMNKST